MAAADNAGTSYYIANFDAIQDWRKLDVKDAIIDQDPRDRPFFEMIGEGRATNRTHKWPVRGVKARETNAQVEGFVFSKNPAKPPNFAQNFTQILANDVIISGTSLAEMHYGAPDIKTDQGDHILYEHSADIELALLKGIKTSGGTNAARQMGGLTVIISTNATSFGGTASLPEASFIDGIELVWNKINSPQLVVMTNSALRKDIDVYQAQNATRYVDIMIREIANSVLRYHSSFGDIDTWLSRDLQQTTTTAEIAFFDPRQMSKAWLRDTTMIIPGVQEDADRLVFLSELTLDFGNEEATALFNNVMYG
jgi:hypothetical protein